METISNIQFTSGTGYIGSFTVLELLSAGYNVVVVDNLYNSSEEALNRIELISGKRPTFCSADVTDRTALDIVFTKHPGIDAVIHFAALKVRNDSCALFSGRSLSSGGISWSIDCNCTFAHALHRRLSVNLRKSPQNITALMLAVQ